MLKAALPSGKQRYDSQEEETESAAKCPRTGPKQGGGGGGRQEAMDKVTLRPSALSAPPPNTTNC
ncbi:hypothetical protein F7725_027332 [Dissostichus mawsoni]|uniref:Uncharacterized protein n=1 Tax=Dissostichus mawsoni TaxID=36200 RepID=A0A7J5XCP4_DISMA|nr:hypothetical protein F7725_027332 [Dissostichus mawsoni]